MKKKLILISILVIFLAICIFIYLHNKHLEKPKNISPKYVLVQVKGSKYPEKIMVLKGTTLQEVLLEIHKLDSYHYTSFFTNKKEVADSYKIFQDTIFTVR